MASKLYGVDATIIMFLFVFCCIVLYRNALYCIVLYCIVLYCIVWYCIVLYYIVLYCIVLYLGVGQLSHSSSSQVLSCRKRALVLGGEPLEGSVNFEWFVDYNRNSGSYNTIETMVRRLHEKHWFVD